MVVSTTKMNARQFLQLGEDPPGVKLELVHGEIAVSPSPTPEHSNVVLELVFVIKAYLKRNKAGKLFGDVDTLLDQFNVRRPDLLYFSDEHLDRVGQKNMHGMPDLAIEVISPSSVEVDREDKFEQYRAAKIRFYWIVDPLQKTIEGWELKRGKYVSVGRAEGNATIRLAPFTDLDISLKELWLT